MEEQWNRNHIQLIELHMDTWTDHYPSGCRIVFWGGEEDGDYCDSVEEYKRYLESYREKIRRDHPKVVFRVDMDDLDISNVMDAVQEIKKYFTEIYESTV